MKRHTLQTLVAEFAAAIEEGKRWRPGDRLPPQRTLARQRRIAASTVSLAYRELARRGFVVGETGRGTYVRAAAAPAGPALAEPSGAYVDLALNVPILPEQARLLADSLATLLRRSTAFEEALRPVAAIGTPAARKAAADFLSHGRRWRIDSDGVIFAGNGKQALGAVVAALVRPGQRLATDTLTYPVIRAIAARCHVELVPVPMDDDGMCPDALESAHLRRSVRAVYCQPTLHNPVGTSMSERRRADLARIIKRHQLIAIEDAVYSFLSSVHGPPLAALAPDRVIMIDSLSKRVAPGLTVGIIVPPHDLIEPIAMAVRSHAYGPSGAALAACTLWMTDGTAAAITSAKRRDASIRQRILRKALSGLALTSDARSYHAWLTLPTGWRAEVFEAVSARKGIAVVSAAAFAVAPGHAPNAVRLALASPTLETLEVALTTLAELARGAPPPR